MNIVKGLAGPLAAVAVGIAHAHATDIRGFTEFEGRWLGGEAAGDLGIMLPFHLDDSQSLFLDLHGTLIEGGVRQGSLGAGYRLGTPGQWTFGFYGYYDYLRSSYGNDFHQLSFGAEALGPVFETRANIYLPQHGGKAADGAGRGEVVNGALKFRAGREEGRAGADAEIGVKVPGVSPDGNAELKLFAGSYWYNGRNVSDMFGGRLRAELTVANVAGLPAGSTFSFGASASYDNEDKLTGGVMARVRIPFGAPAGEAIDPFDATTQAVRRSASIRTEVAASGPLEDAVFLFNGQTVGTVLNISGASGDAAAINALMAGAGNGALILADGNLGLNGSLTLGEGQALLGGGGTLALRGASSSGRGTFTNRGAATTLTGYNPAQDVVTMASGSMISSLAITGGLAGIGSTDTSGLVIDTVDISRTAHDGIRLTRVDGAAVENSTIHDLYICTNNTTCEFAVGDPNRAPYAAISAHGTKNLTVRDTTIDSVTYGIFAGSAIDDSGWPPVITDLASNIVIDNVTISRSRREGILLVAADGVTMNKVTIDNTKQDRDMDLVVLQATSNVRITDMSLKGGINGLMLVTASTLEDVGQTTNVSVDGLKIDGPTNAGIFFNPVSGIDLKNVTITNAGTYGMFLYGSDWTGPVADISFENVVIDNARQAGIYLMGPLEDLSGDVTVKNTPRDCETNPWLGSSITQPGGSVFLVNGQELGASTLARCN
ncbi:right-handed parallel beta-helix repeat-containing protein [Shinella zoogloeoides]|uniref:right-handed parallel beta-helix repeat-containing protein n=1 Tax=Shinella zoogloeoides TaxID=352475 RepID=UPI001F58C025|nr:right-handed parallel beta-helix repeat-containing protein [Shinella zoogloeoides]